MAKKTFIVQFEFTSSKADGDNYTRTVEVKAKTAKDAEDTAWFQRVSIFGAKGNDNAIDCRTIGEL